VGRAETDASGPAPTALLVDDDDELARILVKPVELRQLLDAVSLPR
jgi:hypothetical protein